MRAKHVCLSMIFGLVLIPGLTLAQPVLPSGAVPVAQPTGIPVEGVPHVVTPEPQCSEDPMAYSRWVMGQCKDCCGPANGKPMRSELFLRAGPSWTIGSSLWDNAMDSGWKIEGGGRLLFFNQEQTRAWTVEAGISSAVSQAADSPPNIQLNVPIVIGQAQLVVPRTVNVKRHSRRAVHLSLGYQWYLIGSAKCGCESGGCNGSWWSPSTWRFGFDVGGRWGTSKTEFFQIQHLDDVIGGFLAAVHTDVEFECGCCIFFVGLRAEYNIIFTNVLQSQNDADIETFNVLVSTGLRF